MVYYSYWKSYIDWWMNQNANDSLADYEPIRNGVGVLEECPRGNNVSSIENVNFQINE